MSQTLTHKEVRESVNEADSRGLAAWIYTNFALKEALWVCNPSIKNDPFKMIPLMVQQPYYLAGPEPAYLKVRSMLEEAGATHNMGEAKRQWDSVCKNQDAETQRRASSADDLLVFVRREGQERLAAFMKDAAARQNQK